MTAEIIPLQAACPAVERQPQEDVIKGLEDALARARSGEIQGFCLVELDRDSRGNFMIAAPEHVSFSDLLAHLARLNRRLLELWDPE